MIIYIAIVTGLFLLGAAAGFFCAWQLFREPRKIEANLVIDPKVLHQIDLAIVNAWLDKHGMTWQPKGAVYNPDKVIKK